MAPVLAAHGLVKEYPVLGGFRDLFKKDARKRRTRALDGLDLQVEPGRVFCLLGPNGAGKTTLLKVLATLVLPDAGHALVDGHDVEREPDEAKRAIGYAINDERSFSWRLTGRQNLEFFASLYGLGGAHRSRRIEEVLHLTGLEKAANLRFNAYSTGMRQMLALARALLPEASILLVDEPTRSLDPQAADRVRLFLRGELAEKRGRTVLWATHDLAEASAFADEIAVIHRGRVRAQGSPDRLTSGGRRTIREVYEEAVGPDEGAAP